VNASRTLRITLLVNHDLGANIVADRLLRALPEHHWSLVRSTRVGRPGPRPEAIVELGRHEQRMLRELVEPLKRDQTPSNARTHTFDQLARFAAGGLHRLDRPRRPEGRALLAALEPDLMISVRYGGILDAEHVALAPLGVLNLHSGRLPAYRGVLASFRAMLAGDATLACTLHRIQDEGIDTGPILGFAEHPLDPQRSLLWNLLALYEPGADLLIDSIRALASGAALPGTPQALEEGTYYGVPSEAEVAAFHALGYRLCEFDETLSLLRHHFSEDPDA
jgi:methionyl-tRNA formyltransferase